MKAFRAISYCLCCVAMTLLCSCSDSDTDSVSFPDIGDWVQVGEVEFDVMAPTCSDLEQEGIDYAMDPSGSRPSFSVAPNDADAAKKILARHAKGQ